MSEAVKTGRVFRPIYVPDLGRIECSEICYAFFWHASKLPAAAVEFV
jgi:hypothetical protein